MSDLYEPIDWVEVGRAIEKAAQTFSVIGDIVAQVIEAIQPAIVAIKEWIEDLTRAVAPDFLGIPSSDIRSVTFGEPIIIRTFNWRTIELPHAKLALMVKL